MKKAPEAETSGARDAACADATPQASSPFTGAQIFLFT